MKSMTMTKQLDFPNESTFKKSMRRENNSCFIPHGYYTRGYTQKDYFKLLVLKEIRKQLQKDKM